MKGNLKGKKEREEKEAKEDFLHILYTNIIIKFRGETGGKQRKQKEIFCIFRMLILQ